MDQTTSIHTRAVWDPFVASWTNRWSRSWPVTAEGLVLHRDVHCPANFTLSNNMLCRSKRASYYRNARWSRQYTHTHTRSVHRVDLKWWSRVLFILLFRSHDSTCALTSCMRAASDDKIWFKAMPVMNPVQPRQDPSDKHSEYIHRLGFSKNRDAFIVFMVGVRGRELRLVWRTQTDNVYTITADIGLF